MEPAPSSSVAESNILEILHRRIGLVAWCVGAALCLNTVVLFVTLTVRAAAACAVGAVLTLLLGVFGPRLPARRAPMVLAGSFWLVVIPVCVVSRDAAPWVVDAWLILMWLGSGITQLHRGWFVTNALLGCLAWGTIAFVDSPDRTTLAFRCITVASSSIGSWLVFAMLRGYVDRIEFLRASDARHRDALAEALVQARAELEQRLRLEAEREAMRERAIASQRLEAMGQMAGGVAHELNNILAGILGIACLLRDEGPESNVEDLEAIVAACRRGGDLTHALLKFGRTSAADVTDVGLSALFAEVEPMLRRAIPAGATLSLTSPDPTVGVIANRADLGQAIVNLCLNAFDASAKVVSVTATTRDDAGQSWVDIVVRDDGSGMPPEVIARAFEPFFTTKPHGTGLGLAQVYGATRSTGGTVDIASTPGSGTVVSMHMLGASGRERPAPSAEPKTGAPRNDRTVLVVDDDALVRNVLSRSLGRAGFQVLVANHGLDALERAAGRRIDLAVLDMAMPELDGLQTWSRLKETHPNVRALIVSGHVDDAFVERALAAGISQVLLKPVHPNVLLAALDQVVERSYTPSHASL